MGGFGFNEMVLERKYARQVKDFGLDSVSLLNPSHYA